MDALCQAFAAGTREGPFAFADYNTVRRLFAKSGIPSVPAIDLDALELEDLEDGQEG